MIITNVTSLIHRQLNNKFRELKQELDDINTLLLDTEIKLLEQSKKKYLFERKLEELESKIMESLYETK